MVCFNFTGPPQMEVGIKGLRKGFGSLLVEICCVQIYYLILLLQLRIFFIIYESVNYFPN